MRFQESIYLVTSPGASLWPVATVAVWGEVSPSPVLALHRGLQVRHQPVPFMKYQRPARDLNTFASERWQEVGHSSGGCLFYVNFSVHFPWKWLIFGAAFWPHLLTERLGPLEGCFPLGEPVGLM